MNAKIETITNFLQQPEAPVSFMATRLGHLAVQTEVVKL